MGGGCHAPSVTVPPAPGGPGAARRQRPGFLLLLGLPALGLTFCVTVATTYLPVLVADFGGPLAAGALVAGEGLFGLFVPVVVGAMNDARSRDVGGRVRWLAAAAVLAAATLTAVGLVAWLTTSLVAVLALLAAFYVFYFAFLAPYWALFADLVPDSQAARSRSVEGTWRVAGSGLALVGGGLLLAASEPVPFLVGAGLVLATVGALVVGVRPQLRTRVEQARPGARAAWTRSLGLLRDTDVRRALVCVALWGATLAGVRAFTVLFLTVGVGRSVAFVSGVVFPVAAVGFLAAPLAGTLAERYGLRRVLTVGALFYGVGALIPALTTAPPVLLVVPFVAFGAALVQTLDFALVMTLLPGRDNGTASGLFGFARGLGTFVGPLVCGAAVLATQDGLFASTQGYAAVFPVLGGAVLLSVPVLRGIRRRV